jgi:hypothetical protein
MMSKVKKIAYTTIFCVVSLLISSPSFATHFYSASLDELISKSDFVFIGEVKAVGRTFFGYRKATLRTLEKIKGNALSEISVKYGEPWHHSQSNVPVLIEGRQYLFFLVESESEFLLAGVTGSRYYLVDGAGEVLCGDEKILVKECIERGRKIVVDPKKRSKP